MKGGIEDGQVIFVFYLARIRRIGIIVEALHILSWQQEG